MQEPTDICDKQVVSDKSLQSEGFKISYLRLKFILKGFPFFLLYNIPSVHYLLPQYPLVSVDLFKLLNWNHQMCRQLISSPDFQQAPISILWHYFHVHLETKTQGAPAVISSIQIFVSWMSVQMHGGYKTRQTWWASVFVGLTTWLCEDSLSEIKKH